MHAPSPPSMPPLPAAADQPAAPAAEQPEQPARCWRCDHLLYTVTVEAGCSTGRTVCRKCRSPNTHVFRPLTQAEAERLARRTPGYQRPLPT